MKTKMIINNMSVGKYTSRSANIKSEPEKHHGIIRINETNS
jgi:hypothetical protein